MDARRNYIRSIDKNFYKIPGKGKSMTTLMTTLSILGALFWVGVLLRSVRSRAWKYHLSEDGPRVEQGPSVSVIVPARNEEDALSNCLPSILNQTYRDYEVIVINDQSTDRTSEVLASFDDPRLSVIDGVDRPDDTWTGKSWAVHQGLEQADGDWFLFTDADMTFQPWLLSRVMAEAEGDTDSLFTILPQGRIQHWWNKLILPLHGFSIFLTFPIHQVNDPHDSTALAAGGFMLMHRRLHNQCGGHERVRDRIAEDLAMAQTVKETGGSIVMKTSEGLSSEHYESPRDIVDGITKHVLAMPLSPTLVIPLIQVLFWLIVIIPFILAVPGVHTTSTATFCGLFSIVLSHLMYFGLHKQLNHSGLWGITLLPALIGYSCIGWFAFYHKIRYGGPVWKDRRIR